MSVKHVVEVSHGCHYSLQVALVAAQDAAAAAAQQRDQAEARLTAERQRRACLALELAEHAQAVAAVRMVLEHVLTGHTFE